MDSTAYRPSSTATNASVAQRRLGGDGASHCYVSLRLDTAVSRSRSRAPPQSDRDRGNRMSYRTCRRGQPRLHLRAGDRKEYGAQPGHRTEGSGRLSARASRCGDPHLHTHVIVPNRQARADGLPVSIDGTSLYHEAKAAGVIYQATLRRELHWSLGFELGPARGWPSWRGWTARRSPRGRGAPSVAGLGRAPPNPAGRALSAAQLAAAQKATRPTRV